MINFIKAFGRLQGFQRAVKVIRSDWFFIFSGLFVGIACIWCSQNLDLLHNHQTTRLVIEHLGMGLIVASIAVFGYEWRSQAKKAQEQCEQLLLSLFAVDKLRQTTECSVGLISFLKGEGGRSLENVLSAMLGPRRQSLCKELKETVDNIFDIAQNQTWMSEVYLNFIEGLLQQFVTKNAKALNQVNNGGEGDFHAPANAASIADDFLSRQICIAKPGDSYVVISDISSWRDAKLDLFRKESLEAIKKGVNIRRVFNLFLDDLPHPSDYSYVELRKRTIKVLRTHLKYTVKLANAKGNYEVKVLADSEVRNLVENSQYHATDIQRAHFGIFQHHRTHDTPEAVIRCKVEMTNLSAMKISCDSTEIARDLKWFDDIWYAATDLSENKIVEIDNLLESRSR